MELLKTFILNMSKNMQSKGFTLVEILCVLGLMVVVVNMSIQFDISSLWRRSFSNEVSTLMASLMHARSQSMNNVCVGNICTEGKSHGIHFNEDSYVVFQGADYEHRDTEVDEIIINSKTFL